MPQLLISVTSTSQMLRQARAAHNIRTGHVAIVVYGNFVHCNECGREAVCPQDGLLMLQGRHIYRSIPATEF